MKKIGIVIRDFIENDKFFVGCRKDVMDVFLKYPVEIILVPIYLDFNRVLSLVKECNGVVLTGGDHFLANDFLLVNYLYQHDIPTLGICLGMQTMALSFGRGEEINVSLFHNKKSNDTHHVIIKENTLLADILQKKDLLVNSRHKTAISSTNLEVSARSEDGVIEAVEDKQKHFFLGVEWHPESLKNKNSDLIFEAFNHFISRLSNSFFSKSFMKAL